MLTFLLWAVIGLSQHRAQATQQYEITWAGTQFIAAFPDDFLCYGYKDETGQLAVCRETLTYPVPKELQKGGNNED